jgi:hypothetical protein
MSGMANTPGKMVNVTASEVEEISGVGARIAFNAADLQTVIDELRDLANPDCPLPDASILRQRLSDYAESINNITTNIYEDGEWICEATEAALTRSGVERPRIAFDATTGGAA